MTIRWASATPEGVALWLRLRPCMKPCAALCSATLSMMALAEVHMVSLATNAGPSHASGASTAVFVATHDDADWSGAVTASLVPTNNGTASPVGLWGTTPGAQPVSTATLMDSADFSPTGRVVLSARPGTTANDAITGIAWTWEALADAQRLVLNTPQEQSRQSGNVSTGPDGLGPQRLAFLRGDRSRETPQGGTVFRRRASRHGDILNSKLWHLSSAPASGYTAKGYAAFKSSQSAREAMLYVGANDGMLHGFSALTGQEKVAYVPLGVYPRLTALTSVSYTHRHFVETPLGGAQSGYPLPFERGTVVFKQHVGADNGGFHAALPFQ